MRTVVGHGRPAWEARRATRKIEQPRSRRRQRFSSGYNRLFASRRLRFLGSVRGCPAPTGQTGALRSVSRLQPVDGARRDSFDAVLAGARHTTKKIPVESERAAGAVVSGPGRVAGKSAGCGLAARGVG